MNLRANSECSKRNECSTWSNKGKSSGDNKNFHCCIFWSSEWVSSDTIVGTLVEIKELPILAENHFIITSSCRGFWVEPKIIVIFSDHLAPVFALNLRALEIVGVSVACTISIIRVIICVEGLPIVCAIIIFSISWWRAWVITAFVVLVVSCYLPESVVRGLNCDSAACWIFCNYLSISPRISFRSEVKLE